MALMVIVLSSIVRGQDTLQKQDSMSLTFSGYVEGYYSYDFNKPENNNRPAFLYNFNRHNEFTVNLALVRAVYSSERLRANLSLAAGTYMNANYASEPGVLKNIFEANTGYRLSKHKNLWFDIGVLPSHIGFEGAIGKDNWTMTRSMVAENTPYFESGAKLSYGTDSGIWSFAILALNGWQRITRPDGMSLVSWGSQLVYKPSARLTVNYSGFVGSDKPDSARLWRYYNNLYAIIQLSAKLGIIANIDYGLEQKTPGNSSLNSWYTPVFILRYTPVAKWAFAIRGEYFSDRNGVIIATGTPNGFRTFGSSVNVDFRPLPDAVIRLEGRHFNSKDGIFKNQGGMIDHNTALSFSLAIGF
jgi:hypothetical protein